MRTISTSKSKSDDSPVTAADEAADAMISAGLRAAFPDVMLVTEEQADSHSATGDTFLIVDPLDGTKEFIHRRGDFTVNIALVEEGVPTRGVVYAPAKGRLFLYPGRRRSRSRRRARWTKTPLGRVTPDFGQRAGQCRV